MTIMAHGPEDISSVFENLNRVVAEHQGAKILGALGPARRESPDLIGLQMDRADCEKAVQCTTLHSTNAAFAHLQLKEYFYFIPFYLFNFPIFWPKQP